MHHNTSVDNESVLVPPGSTMEAACLSLSPLVFSISSSLTPVSYLEKRVDEKGYHSLHVTRSITAGTVFAYFVGELVPNSTRYSVQMDENIHIHAADGPAYTNHSCMPTAYITGDPAEKRSIVFVALQDLKPGDEVTCNFNATELISSAPFKCHCGHKMCIGTVRGFDYLTEEQRNHLLATTRLSPYVEMIYKNRQKQAEH
jgi:hypothetical protein